MVWKIGSVIFLIWYDLFVILSFLKVELVNILKLLIFFVLKWYFMKCVC